MRTSILIFAIIGVVAISGCDRRRPVSAQCAGVGMAAGAAVGAATHNNIAQSAIAGGVLGAIAGNTGACRP